MLKLEKLFAPLCHILLSLVSCLKILWQFQRVYKEANANIGLGTTKHSFKNQKVIEPVKALGQWSN